MRFVSFRKAARFAAFILIFCMLVSLFPPMNARAAADFSNTIMRVVLNSDAGYSAAVTALGYANFQIYSATGTGFKVGYYNNVTTYNSAYKYYETTDRSFVPYYDLAGKTAVTVIRGANFNISTLAYADDGCDPTNVIGAYHIELELSFQDQAALDSAVSTVRSATNYYTFPAFTSNGLRVRIGRFTSNAAAQADLATVSPRLAEAYPGATFKIVGKGTNCYAITETGTRNILFEWDGATKQVALLPYGGTVSDEIGSETETWHKNYRFYGGFDFVSNSATTFSVVNVVNLVQYVLGVAPYELGSASFWHDEALKAHALCATTFGVRNINRYIGLGSYYYNFDVNAYQQCQVYRGTTQLTTRTKNCVLAVAGMVITYQGSPIQAVYHSTNGGFTEDSEYVWGGYLAYLRAVEDTFETPYLTTGNYGLWTKTATGEALAKRLNDRASSIGLSGTIGTITNVYVSERTPVGKNVYRLTLTDGVKSVTLTGEQMRTVLGTSLLLSQNFQVYGSSSIYVNDSSTALPNGLSGVYVINGDGTVSLLPESGRTALTADGPKTIIGTTDGIPSFTFDGRGWGHNLGLSQYGSNGMANQGYSYEDIIKYYFTGVLISGLDY